MQRIEESHVLSLSIQECLEMHETLAYISYLILLLNVKLFLLTYKITIISTLKYCNIVQAIVYYLIIESVPTGKSLILKFI